MLLAGRRRVLTLTTMWWPLLLRLARRLHIIGTDLGRRTPSVSLMGRPSKPRGLCRGRALSRAGSGHNIIGWGGGGTDHYSPCCLVARLRGGCWQGAMVTRQGAPPPAPSFPLLSSPCPLLCPPHCAPSTPLPCSPRHPVTDI